MLQILAVFSIALGLLSGGMGNARGVKAGGDLFAAAGGGAKCPLIYAPVICDNGKTYPNQCVADQHHAKNCVPAGQL